LSEGLARYRAGMPSRMVRAEEVAVFTDLHLTPAAPEEIFAFAQSLLELPVNLEALVILGDLFDAYIGPEDLAHPAWTGLWQAVEFLKHRGAEVFLIRGNRDVLMTPKDGQRVGLEVVDSVLLEGEGAPGCLLTHGDAFCLADLPYQKLRRLLRNPLLRPILRGLPLSLRRRLAARLRQHSTKEVARKPLNMLHLDRETVARIAAEEGAQRVVIGHLHQHQHETLEQGVELRVLPAWEVGREPFHPLA
jgi:UDP-2,3-diacylglucosamine hydrolase